MTEQPPIPAEVHGVKELIADGWIAQVKGQHAEAQANFQKAIDSDPNSVEAYYGLAVTAKSLGDFAAALKAFQQSEMLIKNHLMQDDPARASILRQLVRVQIEILKQQLGSGEGG